MNRRKGGPKHRGKVNIKRQSREDRLHRRCQWCFELIFVLYTCFIQEQFKSYDIMTQSNYLLRNLLKIQLL